MHIIILLILFCMFRLYFRSNGAQMQGFVRCPATVSQLQKHILTEALSIAIVAIPRFAFFVTVHLGVLVILCKNTVPSFCGLTTECLVYFCWRENRRVLMPLLTHLSLLPLFLFFLSDKFRQTQRLDTKRKWPIWSYYICAN